MKQTHLTGLAALLLGLILLVALPVLADGFFAHTTSGNWHGHGQAGTQGEQTEAWTEYNSSAQKHASVDKESDGTSACNATGAAVRVDCLANINVSVIDSHHWGPGITDHKMA